MKLKSVITIILSLLVILVACKDKKLEIITPSLKLTKEKVIPKANGVRIEGTFEFNGDLNRMEISIGQRESLLDADSYPVQIDGNDFLVELDSLAQGVTYYYRYIVYYGASSEYQSSVSSFTTITTVPNVSVLDVIKIDAATFRIKCEVISDGGMTLTERGICWNTYGDPHIDDETVKDDGTGVGEYTCRLNHLANDTRYYVRAYAKNSLGTGYSEIVEFGTGNAVTKPTVTTNEVSEINKTTAVVGGDVTSNGGATVTERGICWSSTTPNPTTNNNHISVGNGLGVFFHMLSDLLPGTRYYVRAYAVNSVGTSYGESKNFMTLPDYNLPVVVTGDVVGITYNSATCGGNVTSDGGTTVTERGICWSQTNTEPTIDDSHIASGTGVGEFSTLMTGLSHNTHYYVRAYAINSLGTSYGEVKEFATALDEWLYYGNGTFANNIGITTGGLLEWANMFPPDILAPYDGYNVSKVRLYIKHTGTYTLKIYSGGSNFPENQLVSYDFEFSDIGWKDLVLNSGVAIEVTQPLWVSITYDHVAGQNPACASEGIGNANARWIFLNGRWCDVSSYGMGDLCWLIRVFVELPR